MSEIRIQRDGNQEKPPICIKIAGQSEPEHGDGEDYAVVLSGCQQYRVLALLSGHEGDFSSDFGEEGESGRRVHRRKKGGKTGLFEYAHHGTLFSDEIETMSPALQERWGDAMLLIDHLQRLPGIHFMLTARDRAFIRRSARASRNFGKPLMKRTRLCTEMPAGFLMNQVKGAELWRRPESIFGIGGSQPP